MVNLHQKSTSNRKEIIQLCRDVESMMNTKLAFFNKKISRMSILLYNLNKPRAVSMLKIRKEKRDKGGSIKNTPLNPHPALLNML